MLIRPLILFLFLILTTPAWSDDAVEAAATANITFEKAPEIVMQDETLTISKNSTTFLDQNYNVDVDFHFKNTSNHDVTRKIAFAFPAVICQESHNTTWRGLDANSSTENYDNGLKDFAGTVDGTPIVFTKRVDAMLGQQSITNLLNRLNIPLNPCLINFTSNGKVELKYSTVLQKYHLLTQYNEVAWSENIYYEWTQTFPAGKVVNIHHHYTPVTGNSVPAPRSIDDLNKFFTENIPTLYPLWNRNPATLSTTNPLIISRNTDGNNGTQFCLSPSWIDYRLTTGAYWNGGIGTLKLVVNDAAGAPFMVNEFYGKNDNVQTAINGNGMTFTINNFVPMLDVRVLFLSLPQNQKDLQVCGM